MKSTQSRNRSFVLFCLLTASAILTLSACNTEPERPRSGEEGEVMLNPDEKEDSVGNR